MKIKYEIIEEKIYLEDGIDIDILFSQLSQKIELSKLKIIALNKNFMCFKGKFWTWKGFDIFSLISLGIVHLKRTDQKAELQYIMSLSAYFYVLVFLSLSSILVFDYLNELVNALLFVPMIWILAEFSYNRTKKEVKNFFEDIIKTL